MVKPRVADPPYVSSIPLLIALSIHSGPNAPIAGCAMHHEPNPNTVSDPGNEIVLFSIVLLFNDHVIP